MKFTQIQANLDDVNTGKEWYGSLDVSIEKNKDEVLYAQKVFSMEKEITIVPKSYFNLMMKHHAEIMELLTEKYPEQAMSNDYAESVEFLKLVK